MGRQELAPDCFQSEDSNDLHSCQREYLRRIDLHVLPERGMRIDLLRLAERYFLGGVAYLGYHTLRCPHAHLAALQIDSTEIEPV